MSPGACFMVRAVVAAEADRAAFDKWYADEHLPDAVRMFGARSARRGWSLTDPSVHYAIYDFADAAALRAATGPETLNRLVAEFDRVWGDRVTRTREMIEIAGFLPA